MPRYFRRRADARQHLPGWYVVKCDRGYMAFRDWRECWTWRKDWLGARLDIRQRRLAGILQ